MVNNKVLVKIIMPELDETFDCFIPVNEITWKIKKLLLKSVSDLMGISIDISGEFTLINKDNSNIYRNNDIIINTDIRNGTELYLFSIN